MQNTQTTQSRSSSISRPSITSGDISCAKRARDAAYSLMVLAQESYNVVRETCGEDAAAIQYEVYRVALNAYTQQQRRVVEMERESSFVARKPGISPFK